MIGKAEILRSALPEAAYKNTVRALKGHYQDYQLAEAYQTQLKAGPAEWQIATRIHSGHWAVDPPGPCWFAQGLHPEGGNLGRVDSGALCTTYLRVRCEDHRWIYLEAGQPLSLWCGSRFEASCAMTGQMATGDIIPTWCGRVVAGLPHGGGKQPSGTKDKGSTPRSEHGQDAESASAYY
jgi:hypothetical protein